MFEMGDRGHKNRPSNAGSYQSIKIGHLLECIALWDYGTISVASYFFHQTFFKGL
jgi:hypothetical protein